MSADVNGGKFLDGGLHQRILRMCGGNEKLAKEWWDTPNKNFNLKTPRQLMNDDDWDIVRAYIVRNTDYPGAVFDFGPREQFYNDYLNENKNYYYTDDSVQKYLASIKNGPKTSFSGKRLTTYAVLDFNTFVYDENAYTNFKTFSGVPIGRPAIDRVVIVTVSLHNNTATLRSIHIDGIGATIVGQFQDGNATIAMAVARVPESDMADIIISTDVDVTNYLLGVWSAYDLAFATPYDIVTVPGTEGTASEVTLSTVSNGFAIMVTSSSSGQDHSILSAPVVSVNLTTRFDAYQLSLAKCNTVGADAVTDGNDTTFSITMEGTNVNTPTIAASFY